MKTPNVDTLPEQNGTTPVPNLVLDALMPRLRDTELRVLLLVIRQTYGRRNANGSCNARAWISHAWFRKALGRSSASISQAIDELVQGGFLSVTNTDGQTLTQKPARRAHKGRVYFAISTPLESRYSTSLLWITLPESEIHKAKTIKQKNIKNSYKERGESKGISNVRRSGWAKASDVLSVSSHDI